MLHSGELAEELNATAVSHLEALDDAGIAAMARAGTVGVVLPTTAYILHLSPPPVRKMIDANVPVALGSDFNRFRHRFRLSIISASFSIVSVSLSIV